MPLPADQPLPSAQPGPSPRRTWPVTAAAVLLGWCFSAWVLFVAAINAAAFFGEQPTRDENIESGLALATAAVPLVLLAVVAVRWGSRWGILLLLGPALLLVPMGLEWAGSAGNADTTRDPAPQRPMAWSDLGGELLRPGWALTVVLLVLLAVSVARSRRATGTASDRHRQ
ncbi:hypothetical protein ABEG17_10975 [Pedococcus sp. KACC 23699]|uniref:Uncharacterized protein n=1 Tax=Pedococcus sp. KACC 23699 TaxID=3149228 RepID=A0AAU7JP93_9MICO